MKQSVVLIVCGVSLVSGILIEKDKPYCFQYRWLGPVFNNLNNFNCTGFKGVPCIEPLVNTTDFKPPNTTDIWTNEDTEKLCVLTPGNICITYTFMYNDAVVNTSKYCGKVIEDKTLAVTSGCYTQQIDGYDVEVCACQSGRGVRPCNSSRRTSYSSITLLILSLICLVILIR